MKYCKCEILVHLDTMRVSETSLQLHTEHPETLLETAQRQNVSRGLTNITDELYKFFILYALHKDINSFFLKVQRYFEFRKINPFKIW
jgi:hypothetical protein